MCECVVAVLLLTSTPLVCNAAALLNCKYYLYCFSTSEDVRNVRVTGCEKWMDTAERGLVSWVGLEGCITC